MSNLIYGRQRFGRYIYAGTVKTAGSGPGPEPGPSDKSEYLPNIYSIIAYNPDGTKSAYFGSGSESNNIKKLTFEITETGCGKVEITFSKLPTTSELNYRQRIDIHLFNDANPWYSGYIIERPIEGTTEEGNFKFVGHGYYNLLDKVIINKTYNSTEVSAIVSDIASTVEQKVGLRMNSSKIVSTSYVVSRITLDHVTVKEALDQLSDFAIDYVYGVDQYRELYFKPRVDDINEQARFWVGQHLDSYIPKWDVDTIVNHAYIKGGNVDSNGEQWLAEVEDLESQKLYGIQEDIWTLPSAYAAADATRWGKNQIEKYKEPTRSATVKGVRLEYPLADGTFSVRKLTTDGRAAITSINGEMYTYPINTLTYTVDSTNGIELDMKLGEQPFAIDRYFAELDRNAKVAELLQQAATIQLKTG